MAALGARLRCHAPLSSEPRCRLGLPCPPGWRRRAHRTIRRATAASSLRHCNARSQRGRLAGEGAMDLTSIWTPGRGDRSSSWCARSSSRTRRSRASEPRTRRVAESQPDPITLPPPANTISVSARSYPSANMSGANLTSSSLMEKGIPDHVRRIIGSDDGDQGFPSRVGDHERR